MSSRRRLALTMLTLVIMSLPTLPVLATEAPATTGPSTTAAEGGPTPAVTAPAEDAAAEDPQWTYRYLIPTLIALTVLVVIATTVQYFVQVVRKRYKVVE